MTLKQYRQRISTNATTAMVPHSCQLSQVYIAANNAGSSWKLKLQDRSSPPFVFVPEFTVSTPSLPDWKIQKYDDPLFMEGGIDAVTSGSGPGELAIWISIVAPSV